MCAMMPPDMLQGNSALPLSYVPLQSPGMGVTGVSGLTGTGMPVGVSTITGPDMNLDGIPDILQGFDGRGVPRMFPNLGGCNRGWTPDVLQGVPFGYGQGFDHSRGQLALDPVPSGITVVHPPQILLPLGFPSHGSYVPPAPATSCMPRMLASYSAPPLMPRPAVDSRFSAVSQHDIAHSGNTLAERPISRDELRGSGNLLEGPTVSAGRGRATTSPTLRGLRGSPLTSTAMLTTTPALTTSPTNRILNTGVPGRVMPAVYS